MYNISRILVLLCTVTAMMCASLPSDSLSASIEEVQKKFSTVAADNRNLNSNSRKSDISENNARQLKDDHEALAAVTAAAASPSSASTSTTTPNDFESKAKEKNRNDKMLDYYRYFAPTQYSMPYVPYYNPYYQYQQPYMSAFYSPYYSGSIIDPTMQSGDEYDEEYADSNDVEEGDDGSRANTKRRPGQTKNSPIFYIRLPPTPYMFVPGMGYISQPPTIQPLTPQYPINPFINLPITYLSNAKPTGVFPWNQQPSNSFGTPQCPSYLPQRPQKPYRPKPQMTPNADSKITHLGSYLFNGRPENIFLMPPYHNPYASPYHYQPSPYPAAPIPPTPYNPYVSPIYAPPAIPQYY